ncbi:hypothetical protein [Saccharothrix xinjiangensis]|uniref:SMI1/KNR4 family protein SUKH-1 n=1 Tax=Saccharothrix xinjiangensis TaxID=204798 RepID=A0ABV9YCC7_9PSEU
MNTESADPEDLALLREVFTAERGSGPPLGRPGVRAFEAASGVVLPEPYRTFVAEIADGASSGPPEYGLTALGALPADWGGGRERDLARPFPLTRTWVWEDDPGPVGELEEALVGVFDHGSVVLGTEGCGMNWHLVVTGPHRGHVWQVTGEGAMPFGVGAAAVGPGFAGWVRCWASGRPWHEVM